MHHLCKGAIHTVEDNNKCLALEIFQKVGTIQLRCICHIMVPTEHFDILEFLRALCEYRFDLVPENSSWMSPTNLLLSRTLTAVTDWRVSNDKALHEASACLHTGATNKEVLTL